MTSSRPQRQTTLEHRAILPVIVSLLSLMILAIGVLISAPSDGVCSRGIKRTAS